MTDRAVRSAIAGPSFWRRPVTGLSGLDFAGNTSFPSATPNTPMFGWNANNFVGSVNPFVAYPATYIWRAFPRDQDSFWTFLFHADYVAFFGDAENEEYYGMHPCPDPPVSPWTGPQKWEISSHNGDTFEDLVVFNQWYGGRYQASGDRSGDHRGGRAVEPGVRGAKCHPARLPILRYQPDAGAGAARS